MYTVVTPPYVPMESCICKTHRMALTHRHSRQHGRRPWATTRCLSTWKDYENLRPFFGQGFPLPHSRSMTSVQRWCLMFIWPVDGSGVISTQDATRDGVGIQSNPIPSNPIQSNPILSHPIQSHPSVETPHCMILISHPHDSSHMTATPGEDVKAQPVLCTWRDPRETPIKKKIMSDCSGGNVRAKTSYFYFMLAHPTYLPSGSPRRNI